MLCRDRAKRETLLGIGEIPVLEKKPFRDRTGSKVRPLPMGTVTFLFTDIEGSTRLWEAHPDAMRVALARHDTLLERAITASDGRVFKRGERQVVGGKADRDS